MSRSRILWRILLATLLVALVLAAADLLVSTVSVLLLMFAGVLFGVFLNGISRFLAGHTPLSYGWSYAVVVMLFIAALASGSYYMGSQIVAQATALSSELQSSGRQLTERLQKYEWAQQYLPDSSQVQSMMSGGGGTLPSVMQGVQWIMWGLTGLVVIFFVGLYVAFDPHLYATGVVKLIPQDRRSRVTEVLHKLQSALGYWIIGRLISMSIIGVFTALGLWLLNVPLPVTLGVLAALLTFIPNIGPVLAAVPQALLALKVGPTTVLYVILFNIALQTLESYLITPIVQRLEVTLPPALTIFAQLLMAVLVGVIGIIMAAPLTAAIMVVVQMLYIHDRLDDPDPGRLVDRS